MNIVNTEYSLSRKQLEIYLSGCNPPYCEGCHNSALWDFNIGNDWTEWKDIIKDKVNSGLVHSIAILGGEPLHQDRDELNKLIEWLHTLGKEIWVYTREETGFEELDVDYIKSGRYMKDLPSIKYPEYNLILASNNQKIIKLRG